MNTRIVVCPECRGEGRDIRCGIVYEAGCGHGHRGDVDYGICQGCNGKGEIEEEDITITLDDLYDVLVPTEAVDIILTEACRTGQCLYFLANDGKLFMLTDGELEPVL